MNGDADRQPDDTVSTLTEASEFELCAEVTTREDGRQECTIYPTEPLEGKYTTVWISAADGGFVSVEEMQ